MNLFIRQRCAFLLAAGLVLALAVFCSKSGDGERYDPKTQFRTEEGCVYDKCGGKEYDPEKQYCASDSNLYDVMARCGDARYDPATHVCRDGKVAER